MRRRAIRSAQKAIKHSLGPGAARCARRRQLEYLAGIGAPTGNGGPIEFSACPEHQRPRQSPDGSGAANDARLRILRLLLSAYPDGVIAGDIQAELGIPNSTLSHHLDKLRSEDLAAVRRDGSFLWYTANAEALQEILTFLYAECCTRNKAVKPAAIVQLCK